MGEGDLTIVRMDPAWERLVYELATNTGGRVMGVRLIIGVRQVGDPDCVAMYDSVTGFAFGPVFESEIAAESFIAACEQEPYKYTRRDLELIHAQWHRWWEAESESKDEWPQPPEDTPKFKPELAVPGPPSAPQPPEHRPVA